MIRVAFKGSRWLGEETRKLLEQRAEIADPEEAEVGFSVLHSHIIREPELSAPRRGWINLHIGRLPEYRGIYTVYHAIWNGETNCGVTLHEMDHRLDRGPIIAVDEFAMGIGKHPEGIYEDAFHVALDMFRRWLPYLLSGDYTTRPNKGGRYYSQSDYNRRAAIMSRKVTP